MAYTGAWVRQRLPSTLVPLQPQPDPEHLTPTAEPDLASGQQPLWVATDHGAPTLPDHLVGDSPAGNTSAGGPIDHTPDDPGFGVGGGHGQTTLEAQAVRGELHGEDLGAVAAHQYVPKTDRDGTWYLDQIPDVVGDGDSPATLQLDRTGVGQPNDPEARLAFRWKRWVDRHIDMHRYGVIYRPRVVVAADAQIPQPPVGQPTQLDSPYPTMVKMGTPDAFVAPQLRRSPDPWDQPITGDGVTGGPFGLTSWGL
jgi:hypothetical protein